MPSCSIMWSRTLSTTCPGTDAALLTKRGSPRTSRTSSCRVTYQARLPSGALPSSTGPASRIRPNAPIGSATSAGSMTSGTTGGVVVIRGSVSGTVRPGSPDAATPLLVDVLDERHVELADDRGETLQGGARGLRHLQGGGDGVREQVGAGGGVEPARHRRHGVDEEEAGRDRTERVAQGL